MLIELGRPGQDGRHERFHETPKAETATPPRASIRAQQDAFNRFRSHHNEERPREALGMRMLQRLYSPSSRRMPICLTEHEYPDGFEPRRIRRDGTMKWSGG